MDSNIVKFPYDVSRRVHSMKPRRSKNGTPEERSSKAEVDASEMLPAGGDRRKLRGNPLRLQFVPISPAVTIVGKMHTAALRDEPLSNLHPDIIQQWLGELRAGAENARIVANELDRAAERLLTQANEVATRSAAPAPEAHFIGEANPDLWAEAKLALSRLNVKKRMPEAVKCLHLLLAKNISTSALLVRQRGASKSNTMSSKELKEAVERLEENDQQYITGYIQGLIDGRVT